MRRRSFDPTSVSGLFEHQFNNEAGQCVEWVEEMSAPIRERLYCGPTGAMVGMEAWGVFTCGNETLLRASFLSASATNIDSQRG